MQMSNMIGRGIYCSVVNGGFQDRQEVASVEEMDFMDLDEQMNKIEESDNCKIGRIRGGHRSGGVEAK